MLHTPTRYPFGIAGKNPVFLPRHLKAANRVVFAVCNQFSKKKVETIKLLFSLHQRKPGVTVSASEDIELEERMGTDPGNALIGLQKSREASAQKLSMVPKPLAPIASALNDPNALSEMCASREYTSVPLHCAALLLLGKAFFPAQAHQAFTRDLLLFWKIIHELGSPAFRMTVAVMMKELSPETAALLERQRKESRLRMLGWLSTAPSRDFLKWLTERCAREVKRRPRKGKYAACVGLRSLVASCPNFTQPISETDTLFGQRGNGVVESADILNMLFELAHKGLAAGVKKQAANDAVNRREKRGQGTKRLAEDGNTFYHQFADVTCKAHVLLRTADLVDMMNAYIANPKADIAVLAPLFLMAHSENKPDDELAPAIGTLALAFGRQGNATTYVTHQMGIKPGPLWGRFRLDRLLGHQSCYGKRPGLYCFLDIPGQTVRGVTAGGPGPNYPSAVFLLCPQNFGLHYGIMPMYQGTTYQSRVYDLCVSENAVTKRPIKKLETQGRKEASEYRNTIIKQLEAGWFSRSAMKELTLTTAVNRIITNVVDPQLKKWAVAKGKSRLVENLAAHQDLINPVACLLINPLVVPAVIRSNCLLDGPPVIDDMGNKARSVVRQNDVTEIFDARIHHLIQPLLFDCNERLGFPIHNFLPGIHTSSYECAGVLHNLMTDFRRKKERYGIFNLDVKKCFDTLDFSNPNLKTWLDLADRTLEEMGVSECIRYVLKTMMDGFVHRVLNGSYQHPTLKRGKVRCGLILLPAFWVYLTLPLVWHLHKQRENGHLHFISICGDDFFAVTHKDIPQAVQEEIESLFNSFAADLGFEYHYFKNYRAGEKGDTNPERYHGQRRARTDGPWELSWPKHLPLVHGSIWVDQRGLKPPTVLNRISDFMSTESLRNMIYAQMQLTPYFVPRLALQAAGLFPFRELQEYPLDEESVTIQTMAREAYKKGGHGRRLLYGPGKQASAAYLLLEANKDKRKWFDPYSIPDWYEGVPYEDNSGEEYANPTPEPEIPLPVSKLTELKLEYRSIWSEKNQDYDAKQAKATSLLHSMTKLFPRSQQRYPEVGDNENGYSRLQLKTQLNDDEHLVIGRFLETAGNLSVRMPRNLEKVQTTVRDNQIWHGVTKSRPVAVGPVAWLLTSGFTSARDLTRYQSLKQVLLKGIPLVPRFRFFYSRKEQQFVLSKNARGALTSIEDFKRQSVDFAFELEQIQRTNLVRRIQGSDMSDEVKKELLTSERLTRDISDSEFSARHEMARFYLAQGKVEAALGLCDFHSLVELLNLFKRFFQFCCKANKKLKAFLEDLRSKVEGESTTFKAWEDQRLNVANFNAWLSAFIEEERESRLEL